MNDRSSISDFKQSIDNLYSKFSNKLINFTNEANEKEQLVSEAINDINSRKINKTMYDEMMTRAERRKSRINEFVETTKSISTILDKFKNDSNRFEELYKQELNSFDKITTALNNRYLNTGSKLTQLALAELPENDEELKRKILDALGDTDKTTQKNVVRNMMASVKDARRGRGGSKKHKYLKRNKTIRRRIKK